MTLEKMIERNYKGKSVAVLLVNEEMKNEKKFSWKTVFFTTFAILLVSMMVSLNYKKG